MISTHLISDIESILDEAIFLNNGVVTLHKTVDEIRQEHNKSVDELFREVFRWEESLLIKSSFIIFAP